MNKKSVLFLLTTFALLSCAASRQSVERADIVAALEEDVQYLAQHVDFQPSAFSYAFRHVDEEETQITLFGIEEDGSFYSESHVIHGEEEEMSFTYGGYREAEEEGEEPSYYVLVSEDGEEYDEVEDELEILEYQSNAKLAAELAYAAITSRLTDCLEALKQLTSYEDGIEEKEEYEEGDMYLLLEGETYFETKDGYGFGFDYAYGEISSTEEDEEEEEWVYEIEEPLDAHQMALTVVEIEEGIHLPVRYYDEENMMEVSYEFTFADPTAEEEE